MRSRSRSRSESTVRGYGVACETFARYCDERRVQHVDQLSRSLVEGWYDHLRESGQRGSRSVSTCVAYVRWVEQAWRWLAEHDEHGRWTPYPKSADLPSPVPAGTVAPRWEQLDAAIHEADGAHRDLLVLLRCTGLRVSQGLRLEWRDVDLERAELVVRPELGKTLQERRGRVIPLASVLVEHLAGMGRREGRIVDLACGSRQLLDLTAGCWERAGVPADLWAKRPHHAFRKGFCSGLRRLGAEHDAVEYLVGHDLGLPGLYVAGDALALREAVALVPPVDSIRVLPCAHGVPETRGAGS